MNKITCIFLSFVFIFSISLLPGLVYAKKKVAEVEWKVIADIDLKKKVPGPKLKKILGKDVSILGYMIPLDTDTKKLKNFLLVPYIPSCMHVPPPPAHQIISVSYSGKEKERMFGSLVRVQGKLKLVTAKDKKVKKDPMFDFIPDASFSIKSKSVAYEK